MARQIYFRGQATPANVSLPPTANVASVPHANSDVADIAKGIAGLAGAATKAYLAHEGRIQEGLVDEAYLKARSRMTQWQADYNKTHKAGDALNAQRDYEAQWQQIAGDIAKEYQGRLSGAYAKKFDRGMELGRLYALSHGGVYQEAQTKVWDKNQTELLLQNALSAIDTGDPAQAQLERQRLVEQVQRVHPGENIAPYMQKIDLALFERRFNGKLAQGDFRGAEAMLNGYAPQAQGGGTSSAIQGAPAGSVITTRGKRGSIADDQNNPWNLSKRGTNDDTPRRQRFEVYSSPEEGTLAAFRQFQRYNEGKLGSKVQVGTRDGQPVYAAMNTLRGMVHKWQSGRTDAPAKVVAWMQRQGLDVDSPVDMNTPQGQEAVAQMMSYLAINESSWSISPQQVLQVVRGQGRSGGQAQAPMFSAYDNPQGLVEQGNIDIANRPRVKNADGSVSTVRSISVNVGGKEVLIPTVSEDGRIMSDDEAVEQFRKTGKHLGKFDSVKNAEEYAQRLHEQQERMYVGTGNGGGRGKSEYGYAHIAPDEWLKMNGALSKAKTKQQQDRILSLFANNPLDGIVLLASKEGRAQLGVDGKAAAEISNLLNTQWSHLKEVQKQAIEEKKKNLYTTAINIALGADGKPQDPVTAYRLVKEDPDLDGKTKLEILKAIQEGTLDRDDPGYVIGVKQKIANRENVTDEELAKAMATGKLSNQTKNELLKMRELTNGPRGEIIKAAFKALDEAYRKSMIADGTPEQAQAHYEAIHELQMTIEEAEKKGTVEDILNPSSKNYIIPDIMKRHQLSMLQQVEAITNKVKGQGTVPKRNGNESIEDYLKRRNEAKK